MASWGWNFPIGVDSKTGKIKTTDLETDIKQSILILLSTIKGERLNHKEYGSRLNKFMFEPITSSLMMQIKSEIYQSIYQWENRIENLEIRVFISKNSQTALIVNIQYDIKDKSVADEINYVYDLSGK
jgi:phage baseplate assembly protein W